MAKTTDTIPIWLGAKYNQIQGRVAIPAGPNAEQPGLLFLESRDGSGVLQTGVYLWGDSAGALRYSTTIPTDEDASGTAIGAAGADTALSNIASVQLPDAGDFIPVNDNQVDVGSSTKQFKDIWSTGKGYFDDLEVEIAWIGDEATKTNCFKVAASGVCTLEGTATIDGVGNGDLLDKTATETVSGAYTFSAAGGLTVSGAAGLLSNVIAERTAASGVTIDSVLLKDDSVTASESINIDADNKYMTFGIAGATDSRIYFDSTSLVFYDSLTGAKTLAELAATPLTNPTITGDLTITDGLLTWTDASDEVAGTWTFSNITNDGIDVIANSATTGNILHIQSTSLTSGTGVRVDTAEGTLASGLYFEAYDTTAPAIVWQVGEDGNMAIAGTAKNTDAIDITAGDITLTDGDIDLTDGDVTLSEGIFAATTTADEVFTFTRDNATGTSHGFQVIETNNSGGNAMLIDQDTTSGKTALEIDSESTDAALIDLNGPATTTGWVILCDDANALTTGGVLKIVSNSSDASARDLVYIENTHASADAANLIHLKQVGQEPALFIDMDGEEAAISIDSEATTTNVVSVDADKITTGDALFITADALTTAGAIIHAVSDSSSTKARNLVEILNDNTAAVNADCLYIQQDAKAGKGIVSTGDIEVTIADDLNTVGISVTQNDVTNDGNAVNIVQPDGQAGKSIWIDHNETTAGSCLSIDSESVGGILIDIDGAVLTTGWVLQANDANAFTSGGFLNLVSDSASTTGRSLVVLTNDNTAADAAELITMKQDGENKSVTIDQNAIAEAISIDQDANSASASVALLIDCDNAGTGNQIALDVDQVDEAKSYFARFNATTGWTSTKNPETQAEAGWVKIMVGTTAYFVPYYAA